MKTIIALLVNSYVLSDNYNVCTTEAIRSNSYQPTSIQILLGEKCPRGLITMVHHQRHTCHVGEIIGT